MINENDSVFCELSTDTAVTIKPLSALSVCLHEAKWQPVIFANVITNNWNIHRADMSQLYFMLGITNFIKMLLFI